MNTVLIFLRENFLLLLFAASLSFLTIAKLISLLFRYIWWRHFWGEEYFETPQSAIEDIACFLQKNKRASGLLYDFWSSRWNFIFSLVRLCPDLRTIGIEHDSVKLRYARFGRLFRTFRIPPRFILGDFFTTDISDADIIFVYVPRWFLPQIEEKLKKEMKPGWIAITYRIRFPDWHPDEIIPTDFIDSKSYNNISIYSRA